MKIGFARMDITPPVGTSMCGQLFDYRAKGVESNLYAATMYLDDGRNQVAIVSCDVLMITNEMANDTCRHAEERTGIPGSNIILCATHTHSGPSTVNVLGASTDKRYLIDLKKGIIDSIDRARRNSVDGQLKFSQGEIEGYAFNRRFQLSDGTISTHPLKMDPHIVKVEGPDSKDLKVLCGYDASGKPMGASINFGCHATVMERDNELISSDYPGKLTRYVSEQLGAGAVCLFLQGACGNVCQVNSLDATRKEVGVEWASRMGHDLGAKALKLIHHSATESSGPLRILTNTIEIPRRRVDPELLAWANRHKEIEAEMPTLSDYGVELFNELKPSMVSLDEIFRSAFWSNFYSKEINVLYQLEKEQPHVPLTLKVLAQDNWAMVALPCELFVEWSLAIYDQSPFENTFVVELANGWSGYIPTMKAFERSGGYETKEVTSTMLIPEAGDMILQAVLEMLEEAKT